MTSSLAAQLSRIAATSTSQLDLKAQRGAHSQSLVFEKEIAVTQDFDTIYQICYEGFQGLCALDSRFVEFRRNIFSEQSKTADRLEMTTSQNSDLDTILEEFLALAAGRLLLNPAVKAVDWLVRRFRVHEYNTSFLLLTFLPYHTTPLFLNLLSILPADITTTFKFLYPYKGTLTNPPRYPIVHSATTNKLFFSALSNYVLQICRAQANYQGLLSFWAGITTEAVANMLDSAQAGRIEIQRQKQEDILLQILPVLNSGFALKNVPELVIGCYMVCVVVAKKASLEDKALDDLMEAVTGTWTEDTLVSGITCLSILAQHRTDSKIPRNVVSPLVRLPNALDICSKLYGHYSGTNFLLGLISACVQDINNQEDVSRLLFVDRFLHSGILGSSDATKALTIFLKAAHGFQKSNSTCEEVRNQMSSIILHFSESKLLAPLLQDAVRDSKVDIEEVEFSLQAAIDIGTMPIPLGIVKSQDIADAHQREETFAKAFELISLQETNEVSFLSEGPSSLFDSLAHAFIEVSGIKSAIPKFINLPVLKRDMALQEPLYLSFFVRFFSGLYSSTARSAALRIVASTLAEIVGKKHVDMQAILPYIISTLSDPSPMVRREAAKLLVAIGQISPKPNSDGDAVKYHPWALDLLYGRNVNYKSIPWLPIRDMYKVIHRVILPSLEEYVLDPSQIRSVLECTFRSTANFEDTAEKLTTPGLKKSLRLKLFTFLCSHVVHTPLYEVKLRLLRILNLVGKVGSTTRTQKLLPLLQRWRLLGPDNVKEIIDHEHVNLTELEEQIVSIVAPRDKDSTEILLSCIISQPKPTRPSFIAAVLSYLGRIWTTLKEKSQVPVADTLLQIALGFAEGNELLAGPCRDLLRSIRLSGPILLSFLAQVSALIVNLENHAPAPKRRRTSHNNMVVVNPKDSKELSHTIQKMSFVLELIDQSKPENHPQLIGGLFQILTALHHLKVQVHSDISYLLSLALGNLLAIVNKSKESPNCKLDTSTIRTDLIIDCVRTSDSPQVQNTALLLVAGLAAVAPELVLHSIMPIFTFMGSSILKKDDEYSALVIDQTIDKVVPPLVQSLRNQKRDVVSGTSELLLSFTAAFEHIPSHRRLRLFEALIAKLGPEDFLFAVFATLANRYAMNKDVSSLMTSLVANVGAELQLTTYSRYLDLVRDSLEPKPALSRTLLGIGGEDGRDPKKIAVDLLQTLTHLLRHASLRYKMCRSFESGDPQVASQVHTLFSTILEQTLGLADFVREIKPVSKACGDTLGSLLGTLSLVDFLDTIEVLLGRANDDLRGKVLTLLEGRLEQGHERDSLSQNRVLDFLSTLIGILETSPDDQLKHAAIACIERISDKYGRKDPIKIVAAARVISGEQCISQTSHRVRIMSLLTLASMTESLGQGIIPVIPQALSQSFNLLQSSMKLGEEDPQVHDAVYSLISALLIHVPWLISENLDNILRLSFESANRNFPEESDRNRRETLDLLAKRVDAKDVFEAVDRNWLSAVSEGPKAANEALEIISISINRHAKSSTVKNVPALRRLLLKAFDIRRVQFCPREGSYEEDEVENIETRANEVAIKMIYKLNDTIFRPLFLELTEWATNGLPREDKVGKMMRLTTFYKFLGTFFGTLKSIVTSYSDHIIGSAVEVVDNFRPTDRHSKRLWLAAMHMFRSSFQHDQDEFWQSPTHFTAICNPLISQLSHAINLSTLYSVTAEVIPTIVELAVAADSPDNHKEMNSAIMKFMRPSVSGTVHIGGDNPFVRLAAVKCEEGLTERLGEEWLALLPEMLPYISELMEDDDENVEREVRKWVLMIEEVLGEKLDDMLR